MSRALKRAAIAVVAVVAATVCVAAIALVMLQGRTDALRDGYSNMLADARYSVPAKVEGVEAITQEVSCGYAVIEMFPAWDGGGITEEGLYDEYGKVVTSTGRSFCDEMNKQFPGYETTMRKYLTDSELLGVVHACLAEGVPVPIEWAAKHGARIRTRRRCRPGSPPSPPTSARFRRGSFRTLPFDIRRRDPWRIP